MLDKLCLLWQDVVTRQWFHVANLTRNSEGIYSFAYEKEESNKGLDEAVRHGYQLHPSFEDISKEYISKKVFSTFDRRLPNFKRKDYQEIYKELGLTSESSVFDILTLTGGILKTDSYEFVEPIKVDSDGRYKISFYLRGWRHHNDLDSTLISTDNLSLEIDEGNQFDENAVCVLKNAGKRIGYIPSFYSEFMKTEVLEKNLEYELEFDYKENLPSHYKVRLTVSGKVESNMTNNKNNSKFLMV